MYMHSETARHLWDSSHYYKIRALYDDDIIVAQRMIPAAKEICSLNNWAAKVDN